MFMFRAAYYLLDAALPLPIPRPSLHPQTRPRPTVPHPPPFHHYRASSMLVYRPGHRHMHASAQHSPSAHRSRQCRGTT